MLDKLSAGRDSASGSTLPAYPGFLVRRAWQIHVAIFLEETQGFDMTPLQFSILLVLRDCSDLSQAELAMHVGIDRSNLADILRRMTRAGLVSTIEDPRDRRARVTTLTSAGRKVIRRLNARVERSHARLLEDLSARERTAFMTILTKVIDRKNELGRAPLLMR